MTVIYFQTKFHNPMTSGA